MKAKLSAIVYSALLISGVAAPASAHPRQVADSPPNRTLEPPTLRLPEGVRPTRQAIELTLDPREERFSGTTEIEIALDRATSVIWLNAAGLTLQRATLHERLRSSEAQVIPGGDHFVGFRFAEAVGPGTARLHLTFEGTLSRRDTEGLFAQQEGNSWYVFTQFQPLGARRAFPCFDEPTYKIPWQVTLRTSGQDAAFSNTPPLSTARGSDGRSVTVFRETRPLPSYLVAVAVGFEVVDGGKAGRNQTPIRIIVPQGHTAAARWAVETTPGILSALEDYFDSPYPYEKLDQVAVPVFFGAMENAGLITYGQTIMLQVPGQETIRGKRQFVMIAAHELAHQWFGNLVTGAWWDDLWLNEAFASWMGDRIARAIGPEWGLDVDRVVNRSDALTNDTLASARHVRQPIESMHDIANAFDAITYVKGEAVLYMFEAWLGEHTFRDGVRRYMTAHAGGTATAGDFIRALGAAAGRDLAPAFASFLDQRGAPVVTLGLTCSDDMPQVSVRQEPFRALGAPAVESQQWDVPVCIRYESGKGAVRDCALLRESSGTLPLKAARCPTWVLANDRFSGYYRTRYEHTLLNALLASSAVSTAERVGLLRDASALIASGDIEAGDALEIASRLAADDNRHIVRSTISIVSGVGHLVRDEHRAQYASLVRSLYGPRARELGWHSRPGEAEDARLLRAEVLRIVGTRGRDRGLANEAVGIATRWLQGGATIEPDLIATVLQVAARSGDRAFFELLRAEAKRTGDRTRRERLLVGLGAFRSAEIVPAVLALTLDEAIDARESLRLLFDLASDPESQRGAFHFLVSNYDRLTARLPQGSSFDLSSYLPFVGAEFCDPADRAAVAAFFKARIERSAGGPRNLAQALEAIDMCVAQRRVQESSVTDFLTSGRW